MVSVGDAVGFAKIVQSLLHTSLDERRSVGNKGRSRVLDNYSLKNMVNEYSSVYKELVL